MEKLPLSPRLYGPEPIHDFFAEIGATEKIGDILKGLNSAQATGLDNISARFLKDAADLIAPFITHIIRRGYVGAVAICVLNRCSRVESEKAWLVFVY